MGVPSEPIIRFDPFEVDTRSGELRKQGRRIRLPEQSFQVLSLLLAHPGEVVTRGDLRQHLWPTATAGDFDSGLNNAVKKLRDALGDSADAPLLIETLPRRGYRFLGQVAAPVPGPAPALESAPALDEIQVPETAAEQVSPSAVEIAVEPGSAPRPRVAMWRVVSVLVVILVAGVAFSQRESLATLVGGSTGQMRSLVVLPFDNLTGDASQDYFVDSVSAALTTHLSQVAGLDVISRTTAQQFKRTDKRIPDIGSALNVEGIVEGEVVRSGTNVRIMVKLIRASTDRNVWSRPYDGSVSDMISLQQKIALELAVAAGHPRLQPGARRLPVNAQAYDAYLNGLTSKGQQRYEGFRRAADYFEQAVTIQPDFAEAYAELALSQLQFLFGGPVSPRDAIPGAEAAANEALRLDDTLELAHRVLGQILCLYYWRWDEGERSLQRAFALPGAHQYLLSVPLARRGRFDEALAAAERGKMLDPLSVNAQMALATAYRAAGQPNRAIEEFRRALDMSPSFTRANFQLGATFAVMGRLPEAIDQLEIAARPSPAHNPRMEAYLGYAYAAAGRTKDARAVLAELEAHRRQQYVSSFGIALIHDALGETEPALTALERAHDDHAVEFGFMDEYPKFKAIASQPRFQSVMQSVGLPR